MDIEQLSKSQIVLLTLLVSFVTSIATGIVTVSLMEQAPPIIAQTVNRVIERTVETVSASPNSQAGAAVVTQEKTVIVRESEQISNAVSKVEPSLVRIYESAAEGAQFLSIGIVMDASTVITDIRALEQLNTVSLALGDGTRIPATVAARNSSTGVAYLAASTTEDSKLTAAKFAADAPILGQAVVSLSGKTVSRVAEGIVTTLLSEGTVIDTDIKESSILPGSPLINLDGVVIGVSTGASRASSNTGFLLASQLLHE
jgi:hypothetical protein